MTIIKQDIAITVTIRDIDGAPANPQDVIFTVTDSANQVTTYNLASPNVSVVTPQLTYRCVFDASVAGFYKIKTEALDSESAVVAVGADTFYVSP